MAAVICLHTYPSRLEAELAQARLTSARIAATVAGNDAHGWQPGVAFAGGVKLMVDERDATRASDILGLPPRGRQHTTRG